MKSIIETIVETQKISLDTATGYANTYLLFVEQITQFNIDATRTALEKSAEVSLLCLEESLAQQNTSGWHTAVQRVLRDIPGCVKKTVK